MKIKGLLVLLFALLCCQIYAGNTQYTRRLFKSPPSPPTDQLLVGSVLDLRDPAYTGTSGTTYSTKVSLIYGREALTDLSSVSSWSYKVPYSISFYDFSGNIVSTFIDSIKVAFNNIGSVYESTRLYNYPSTNYYRSVLTVGSTIPVTGTPPSDIRLELTLIKDKIESLSPVLPHIDYDPVNKNVFWSFQVGAESYQLEWVFIDTFDVYTPFVNPQDPFIFQEPVRISTTNQYYKFNNTYPKGTVYFRVRGVGYFPGTTIPQYGAWSYGDDALSNEALFISQKFEPLKNWQFTSNYAEDGKFKKSLSYYDGSLKSRQSLVNVSSDTTVIISESKYDFEGRGVVNVMPAPLKRDTFNYVPGFNKFTSKTNYDNNTITGSLALDTNSGASRYYSSLNDFSGSINNSYVPLAQGYAYSQVKYTRDNTGRVLNQTGVGKTFHLFSDTTQALNPDMHFTQNFYGTPTDTELKKIFGKNAGKSSHYKKNISIDPNGQITVTYLDQEGRVVATALAGNPSNTPNLIALPYNNPATVKVNLNDNNIVDSIRYLSKSVSKIQNVVPNVSYDFNYDLTGVVNHIGSTYGMSSICKTCTYNLNVQIIDPRGKIIRNINEKLVPPTVTCSNNTYAASDTNIHSSKGLHGVVFSSIGEYTVIKQLTLDSGSVTTLLSDLKASSTNYPNLDTLVKHYLARVDSNLCNITCQDHCTAKVFKDHPTWKWSTDASSINAAVAICMKTQCTSIDTTVNQVGHFECESIKQQIIQQVSPGGYYNTLSGWFESHISGAGITWHRQDGTPRSTAPSYDSLRSADKFQSQWATDMFASSLHPEKCHYNNCISDTLSSIYDKNMARIGGWNEAVNKGYINPLNMTLLQGSPTTNNNQDPFFTIGRGSGQKSSLVTLMSTYKTESTGLDYNNNGTISGSVSLWTYTNYTKLYNNTNTYPDTTTEWNMFRSLYMGEKINKKIAVTTGSCPYLPNSINTIVPSPSTPSDTNTINSTNMANVSNNCMKLCDENVKLWMSMLTGKCSITWSGSDSLNVAIKLRNYCGNSCGFANPLALLLQSDLGVNSNLVSAQTILNGYSCKLDSIAFANPCLHTKQKRKTTVTRAIEAQVALLNEFIQKHKTIDSTGAYSNVFTFGQKYDISSYNVYSTYADVFQPLYNQVSFGYPWHPVFNPNIQWCNNNLNCKSDTMFLWKLTFTYDTDLTKISSISNLRVNPANTSTVLLDFTDKNGTYTIQAGPTFHFGASGDSTVTVTKIITVCDSVDNSFASFPFNSRSTKDSCIAAQKTELTNLATQAYNDTLTNYISSFLSVHFNKCFNSPLLENFYYSAQEPLQYHYTLYYYDQAGNLIQTVPSAGDSLLGTSAFDITGKYDGTSLPVHRLTTLYKYNTLNQLIWQKTPDAGSTNFYYNDKGQIRLSQNANQKALSVSNHHYYSYTKYDAIGRITEVGQVDMFSASVYDSAYFYNPSNASAVSILLNDGTFPSSGTYTLTEITQTLYDSPDVNSTISQQNLRGRVSSSVYMPTPSTAETKTYYSYDIHGNVKTLAQNVPTLGSKQMDYQYDLISGNVNQVTYQRGQRDQFIHKYIYDLDNRIKSVRTSRDSIIWDEDAKYFYYKHGPLARTELGEDKVQGTDYFYTLQGWLKNINIPHKQYHKSTTTFYKNKLDPGLDGLPTSNNKNQFIAQDDYMMSLSYFQGDYQNIKSVTGLGSGNIDWTTSQKPGQTVLGPSGKKGLYNGNIVMMLTDIREMKSLLSSDSSDRAMVYQYDQLHRLMNGYNFGTYTSDASGWSTRDTSVIASYDFHSRYDENGNITQLKRAGASNSLIDNLSYNYNKSGAYITNNKLRNVTDPQGQAGFDMDISTQPTDNYRYDQIGNLIKDSTEFIQSITWSLYGKVLKVTRDSIRMVAAGQGLPDLEFKYDAAGNRVMKITKYRSSTGTGKKLSPGKWTYTYYVHDATGNVMSIHNQSQSDSTSIYLSELPIYGSKRIGELQVSVNLTKNLTYNSYSKITLQPEPGLGKDANTFAGTSGGTNFGTFTSLEAGAFANNGTPGRAYIDFDRSYIPVNSIIKNATLTLSGDASVGPSSGTANSTYLRRITSAWTESIITGNNSPTTTTTNQVSIGVTGSGVSQTPTVTTLLQDMSDNRASSFGFQLILQNETATNYAYFVSSDHTTLKTKWPKIVFTYSSQSSDRTVGMKDYELKDHLGNVRVVINDLKIGRDTSADGKVDFYNANIAAIIDYGPFGEILPGRSYHTTNYRYGFNGQEMDNEISGSGNSYTAEFWQFDPRLGRRWNRDPVIKAWESPYMTFGNNPILNVDPNGNDWFVNKKDGSVIFVKGQSKVPSQYGSNENWENLGKDNMFDKKGQNFSKNFTLINMSSRTAQNFMKKQGYVIGNRMVLKVITYEGEQMEGFGEKIVTTNQLREVQSQNITYVTPDKLNEETVLKTKTEVLSTGALKKTTQTIEEVKPVTDIEGGITTGDDSYKGMIKFVAEKIGEIIPKILKKAK